MGTQRYSKVHFPHHNGMIFEQIHCVHGHPPPNEPPATPSVDPILQLPNFIGSFCCIVSIVEKIGVSIGFCLPEIYRFYRKIERKFVCPQTRDVFISLWWEISPAVFLLGTHRAPDQVYIT